MILAIMQVINGLFGLINMLILVWCLLTWFPNIRWYDQPFKTLDRIVTPILAPFKKLIPPIGNIDISAMVAIFVLGAIQSVLNHAIIAMY
jgi:YggT family protein